MILDKGYMFYDEILSFFGARYQQILAQSFLVLKHFSTSNEKALPLRSREEIVIAWEELRAISNEVSKKTLVEVDRELRKRPLMKKIVALKNPPC